MSSPKRRGRRRTPKYHIGTKQQAKLRTLTEGKDPARVLLFAIDSSKFFHKGLLCNRLGEILEPPFEFDIYQGGFNQAMAKVREIADHIGAQMVLAGIESTGHYHENLVRHLQSQEINGEKIRVILINPFSTNEMRNLNLNNIKTDDLDLDAVAELMISHKGTRANLHEGVYLELCELCRWRRTRVDDGARLKQQIQGHLDRIWPGILNSHESPKGLFASFDCKELRGLMQICPSPHKALELGANGLRTEFRSRGYRMGIKRAARIIYHAENTLRPRPQDIEHRLNLLALDAQRLEVFELQLSDVEVRIRELLRQTPGIWLTSIRGVADITAAEVTGEIGAPEAYDAGGAVVKLAGMNPSYCQTGVYESERNPITYFGRPTLRRTAIDTARRLSRLNPYFKVFYDRLREAGKPKKLAHVAVGCKFLRVCLAVMQRRCVFNPPAWKDKSQVALCVRDEGIQELRELGLLNSDALNIDAIENAFEGGAASA